MKKAYKYRLYPNKNQIRKLDSILDSLRFLYNCALEHRILCYKQWKYSVNWYEQCNSIKEIRDFDGNFNQINHQVCNGLLRKLDKTFKSFFRRVKRGEIPGFPRFKGRDRFNSFTFPIYGNGVKIKEKKLYIQNIGEIKFKLYRNIEGNIKTVTIKKENGKFYVIFSCGDVPLKLLPESDKEVGIDLGLKNYAVFSDGIVIENPRHLKQKEKELKLVQQRYSKHKGKRTKKKLSRLHSKIKNQRCDFLHKLSRSIVNKYQNIYIEDLKIQKMIQSSKDKNINKKLKKGLNRSTNDAAWSMFSNFLFYKAEEAGRTVIRVPAKGTTQMCSKCGNEVHKDLSVRVHSCSCGLNINRDLNAALNILRLGHNLYTQREAAECITP